MKGIFIVLDGIDGAGRSTQARKLGEYFKGLGYETVSIHEPTEDSEAGREIRRLLQSKEPSDPMELQKLFVADRADHAHLINKWRDEGKAVIFDRYIYSTIAFGSADAGNEHWNELAEMNASFPRPDIAFIFTLSAEQAMQRIESRGEDKERFEKQDFLAQAMAIFIRIAGERSLYPETCLLYAVPDEDKVFEYIKFEVDRSLTNKKEKVS